MLSALKNCIFSPYIDALLDAVFLLAFYAFLRAWEFTTSSQSFDPSSDISFSDLAFHSNYYSLCLKHFKCRGAFIVCINSPFCPFTSMIKYLQISLLFLIPGNIPLSKSQFNYYSRQVLIKSSISPQHYSEHSFGIGVTTSAANQGISSSSLQHLGCWSSSTYTFYIRPDISAVLANQRRLNPQFCHSYSWWRYVHGFYICYFTFHIWSWLFFSISCLHSL